MLARRLLFSLLLVCGVSAAGANARAADAPTPPPSAHQFYAMALDAMSALPQPSYVTFSMRGHTNGTSIGLEDINHLIWLGFGQTTEPVDWKIAHRTVDYASAIHVENGPRYVSARSFFDPTWYGALRALAKGMLEYQDHQAPIRSHPKAPSSTDAKMRRIAVMRVMGPGIYRVEDRGAAACSNGDPGHALHLISRSHSARHQLSDVVIDLRNLRFCSVRFGIPSGFGFSGIVEEHFGEVGGYWVETDGLIDGNNRLFGISLGRFHWRYSLDHLAFPASLPEQDFVPPPTQ